MGDLNKMNYETVMIIVHYLAPALEFLFVCMLC